jgi:hypothetical protein
MGELERVVRLHFGSNGYTFPNGIDILHAQILVRKIGPEVASGNNKFGRKESMGFLVGGSDKERIGSRRNHVDHGIGDLGTNVVVPKLKEIVYENDGLS